MARKRNKGGGGAKGKSQPSSGRVATGATGSPSPVTPVLDSLLGAAPAPSPMRGVPPAPAAPPPLAQLRPVAIDLRSIAVTAGLAAAAGFLWALRDLWTTFLFTGVVVFVGAPLVERLDRRGWPRAGAAAAYLAGLLLILVALSLLVLPTLIRELGDLFRRLPEGIARLEEWVEARFAIELPGSLAELLAQVMAELDLGGGLAGDARSAISSGGAALGKGAASLWQLMQNALGAAGRTLLIPVLAFFVLTELPDLRRFIARVTPTSVKAATGPVISDVHSSLTSLVRGQLTVALIMAVIYAVGLSVSGVPLALAISILSGVAYLIPFASATVCVVLSLIFTALEVPDVWARPLIGALVTAVVVQVVESWVLTPRVVGESAGLSPLTVVLTVLVAGTLFGFLGVLFALPVATVLGVILKEKPLAPA